MIALSTTQPTNTGSYKTFSSIVLSKFIFSKPDIEPYFLKYNYFFSCTIKVSTTVWNIVWSNKIWNISLRNNAQGKLGQSKGWQPR